MKITRNRDPGDESPEQHEEERLWQEMDRAIELFEHASMMARETDDPWWSAAATWWGMTADRAVAAYEAAKGGA
jgi:hypothetical protein